jgi:hypothetical protein
MFTLNFGIIYLFKLLLLFEGVKSYKISKAIMCDWRRNIMDEILVPLWRIASIEITLPYNSNSKNNSYTTIVQLSLWKYELLINKLPNQKIS